MKDWDVKKAGFKRKQTAFTKIDNHWTH